MPTTFNAFYLGTFDDIDPTEGKRNQSSENADQLRNRTFGSSSDGLFDHIVSFRTDDRNNNGYLEQNKFASNDHAFINYGNGEVDLIFDGGATYNTTITYKDGSTVNTQLVVVQMTTGELFVVPSLNGSVNDLLDDQAIQSITLGNIVSSGGAGMTADRPLLDFLCFTRGTRIETDRGAVPVEMLRPGDLVRTLDHGLQPLRWIGARSLSAAELAAAPHLCPVRIRAGALGAGLPLRDLTVSPQHRVLVRSKVAERMFGAPEVLVAAKHLTELDGIDQIEGASGVDYWHFLLDRHEVVFSEGARTESLFTGPEAMKALSPEARAEILTLFPELAQTPDIRPSARPLVNGRQGRSLAHRHAMNRMAPAA